MTPDAVGGDAMQVPAAAALALSVVLLHRRHPVAMLRAYAAQSAVLALAAAWQGAAHGAPQLYLVAAVALAKAALAPRVLRPGGPRRLRAPRRAPSSLWGLLRRACVPPRDEPPRDGSPGATLVRRLDAGRAAGPATVGLAPLALGAGLVALAAAAASVAVPPPARAGAVLALSVLLLGLLVAATRRDAPSRAVGLLSSENGLVLALVGAPGMPLAAGLCVASLALAACAAFGACAPDAAPAADAGRPGADRGPR